MQRNGRVETEARLFPSGKIGKIFPAEFPGARYHVKKTSGNVLVCMLALHFVAVVREPFYLINYFCLVKVRQVKG